MNKEKQKKLARFMIASGLSLIVLSIFILLYWWMNQTPIIVQANLPTAQNTEIASAQKEETNWQLEIPIIEVSAPISLNVDGNNETQYLSALEKGVAQLAGSSIPGQSGNVFIFGHSSYYFYNSGKYKSVFRNLNKLEIDDEVKITSNLKTYNYQVVNKKIVNPDQVDIVESKDDKQTLTLMTCYPLYTSLKRLVIIAEEN